MEYESLANSPWVHGTFWVFIAVVIFALLFGKKILGPVGKALDGRGEAIRLSLEEAARLKVEAEAMLASARIKRDEALAEAQEILARAKDEALRMAAELAAEAETRARARERMVTERIAAAEASAITDVRAAAVEIAIAATAQALREGLGAAQDAALVDRAIANVPTALAARAA
jgi:F-type H+-transporting ATPase subunit b